MPVEPGTLHAAERLQPFRGQPPGGRLLVQGALGGAGDVGAAAGTAGGERRQVGERPDVGRDQHAGAAGGIGQVVVEHQGDHVQGGRLRLGRRTAQQDGGGVQGQGDDQQRGPLDAGGGGDLPALRRALDAFMFELDRMTLRDAVAAPSVAASLLGIDDSQRRIIPLLPASASRTSRSAG